MKTATTISLTVAWWRKEQPDGLRKSATPFEKAIDQFAKADAALSSGKTGAARSLEKAIADLASAGKQVAAEAKTLEKGARDKKAKADYTNTIAVMGKPLARALAEARQKLGEASAAEADAPANKGGHLADPAAHAAFITNWGKRIKKGIVFFAIALPSNAPEEMRFDFHRRKDPRKLAAALKRELKAPKVTYGRAGGSALAAELGGTAREGTLVLELHGKVVAGLAKRTKKMLGTLGVSGFTKVQVMAGGVIVDSAEGEDGGAEEPVEALDLTEDEESYDDVTEDEPVEDIDDPDAEDEAEAPVPDPAELIARLDAIALPDGPARAPLAKRRDQLVAIARMDDLPPEKRPGLARKIDELAAFCARQAPAASAPPPADGARHTAPTPPDVPTTDTSTTAADEGGIDLGRSGVPGEEEYRTRLQEKIKLTDEQVARLDAWIEANAFAEEGDLITNELGGERLAEAMKGQSDLGALTNHEMAYLVARASTRWVYAPRLGEDGSEENFDELAAAIKDDPNLSRVASVGLTLSTLDLPGSGGGIWNPGTDIGTQIDERDIHMICARYAIDLDTDWALPRLVNAVGSEKLAKLFTGQLERIVLSFSHDNEDIKERFYDAFPQETQNNVLDTVARGGLDDEDTIRFAEVMFAGTTPEALADPREQANWSSLLADWLTQEKRLEGADRERIKADLNKLLASEGGQKLLFDPTVDDTLRRWALEQIAKSATDPDAEQWKPEDLTDGWESKVVCESYSKAALDKAALDFREPLVFTPEGQQGKTANLVGQLLNIPPNALPPENETPEQRKAREAAGIDHPLYDMTARPMEELMEQVNATMDENGEVRITPIPITLMSNETGVAIFKVLRIEKAEGPIFLDHRGARYTDAAHWKEDNDLPAGKVTFPAELVLGNPPDSLDTFRNTLPGKAVDALDKAVMAAGVVAGVVLIVGTDGLATPFVLGAASTVAGGSAVYTGVRAGQKLADQHEKGYEVGDLSDPEIRGLWLELGSSAMGAGAMAGGARSASLLAKGEKLGRTSANVVAGLSVGGNVADAIGMADAIQQLSGQWSRLTPEQQAQALLQMSMQVGMSVGGARKGGGKYLDGFDFKRVRNQLENGTPFPLEKATEADGLEPGVNVAVRYDTDKDGNVTNIRIVHRGDIRPDADMIALHSHAGATMEASTSLETRLSNWLHGRPEGAKPGTAAWEAEIEITKIQGEAKLLTDKLTGKEISDAEKAEIEARLVELDIALVRQAGRLSDIEAEGLGNVASPATGADQARSLGYPDPPEKDMIWVASQDKPFVRNKDGSGERIWYIESERRFVAESELTPLHLAELEGRPLPIPVPEPAGPRTDGADLVISVDQAVAVKRQMDAAGLKNFDKEAVFAVASRARQLGLDKENLDDALEHWKQLPGWNVDDFIDNMHLLRNPDIVTQDPIIRDPVGPPRENGPVQPSPDSPVHNNGALKKIPAPESVMDEATRQFLAGHDGASVNEDIAGTGGIQRITAGEMTNGDDGAIWVAVEGEILPGLLHRGSGDAKDGQRKAPGFDRSAKLNNRDKMGFTTPEDWERCHLWGPGFGDEAMAGMYYGPRELNQAFQNRGIEALLRELGRQVAPHRTGFKLTARATVETWGNPTPKGFQTTNGEPMVRRVRYDVILETPAGQRTARVELEVQNDPFDIDAGTSRAAIDVEITETAFRDMFDALPMEVAQRQPELAD